MEVTGADLPDWLDIVTILNVKTKETRKITGLVLYDGQTLLSAIEDSLSPSEVAIANYQEIDLAKWCELYYSRSK